jgi:hypothetical protein
MFPHETRRAWWTAGRAKHLLAGFVALEKKLPARMKPIAASRMKSLALTLKIKIVFLGLFYFSFVTTGFSWLAQYWDKLIAVKQAMDAIAEIASTFSFLVLVGLLLVSRHASILEMNLLLLSAHAKTG